MAGEAADVQLVNDGVRQGHERRHVLLPVEGPAEEKTAARGVLGAGLDEAAPDGAAGDGGRRRVDEDEVAVEAVAAAGRAIDAPAVAERGRQAADEDVPVVAGAVAARVEGDLAERLRPLLEGVQHERHGRAVPAEQGEVDAVGLGGGAEGQGTAARAAEGLHGQPRDQESGVRGQPGSACLS
jgi:hypothetical protein